MFNNECGNIFSNDFILIHITGVMETKLAKVKFNEKVSIVNEYNQICQHFSTHTMLVFIYIKISIFI